MKIPFIVESVSKAKTIQKYVGDTYNVIPCLGHIRDFDKKRGTKGIDIDNDYEPIYKAKSNIKNLKDIDKAPYIICATDMDREGEAISWHILDHFNIPFSKHKRVIFTEITKDAIQEAIKNPTSIDMNCVQSQKARSVMDWIIGFQVSQTLTSSIRGNGTPNLVTIGRVQSAILRLIIDTENTIQSHEPTSSWHVNVQFNQFDAKIQEALQYNTGRRIMEKFQQNPHSFKISHVSDGETSERAPLPFITSTLQTQASSELGFSLSRTMKTAQTLYEHGKITYMRTDSTTLSSSFTKRTNAIIKDTFGSEYCGNPPKPSKGAHEAIRPCHPDIWYLNNDSWSLDCQRLYKLIHKRTIASCMSTAKYATRTLTIQHPSIQYNLYGTARHLIFPGWKKVYGYTKENTNQLSQFEKGQTLLAKDATAKHYLVPPPKRYHQASLVKRMENDGIGRPSTYATIVQKIVDSGYAETRDMNGQSYTKYHLSMNSKEPHTEIVPLYKERNVFVPTKLGEHVFNFLSKNIEHLTDIGFTKKMEDSLDMIANGSLSKGTLLQSFHQGLLDKINAIDMQANKVQIEAHKHTVHYNGTEYVIRQAKYGPVVAYTDNDGNTVFINLKHYCRLKKKRLQDIDSSDISILTHYPRKTFNSPKQIAAINQ